MILLLSTRKKARVGEDLAQIGGIRSVRVPRRPTTPQAKPDDGPRGTRPSRPDPDWAFRRLDQLRRVVAEEPVAAIVCADPRAHLFALELAEQHPDIPVFSDQSVAARILSELRDRGIAPTRGAVHDLLDPQHPSVPASPRYLFDPADRPPLVVSLVQNAVVGDSRVQKVAATLAEAGYQSVLLATNPPDEPDGDWFLIGDAVILRLPVKRELHLAQRDSPPGPIAARALGYRSSAQDRAAWQRLLRREELATPGRARGLVLRTRGRMVELRSWLYRRNRRSFSSQEHRRAAHERRGAALASRFSRADPEHAYPLIADMEAAMGPAIDALKPDAIHVHDPMLLGIAVRAKRRLARLGRETPIIFDAHEWTLGLNREHAYLAAVSTRLEQRFIREAAETITVTEAIADKMMVEFSLQRRPTVVENGPTATVDDSYPDIRTDAAVPSDAPLLVYVGGLAERRGVDDAVAALKQLPQAHLVLVSPSGGRLRQLRRRARESGVGKRLHHLPYVPADKVISYIRTADVGLIPARPLLNNELGIPTKFREYLLAGIPMVGTDIGSTGELIGRTGVGELCTPGKPKSLARAVTKVLADPEAYTSRMTDELRTRNTWETQSKGLLAVYDRQLGPPPPKEPARDSVLIGATNTAGQAYEWASALRRAGIAATSLELRLPDSVFTHHVDTRIPRTAISTLDRKVQLLLNLVADKETIVMESGRSIAAPEPGETGSAVNGFREARALRESGRNVGLIFHGSDIRRPDIHARTHPWSPFASAEAAALTGELRKRTRVVHEQLAAWDGPVMVSTPDLIGATAGAVWTPVVLDTDRFPFRNRELAQTRTEPPIVVHMPSLSLLKGSHLIDPVLRRLAREGIIRYRRVEGVAHSAVPGIMAECDIFVDQLGMGIFGVAPLEAMATGAVVVTDPGPEALNAYGEDLPIVEVDPTTVEGAVRELAGDHDRRRHLSQVGRDFVIRHHDGRRSAAAMAGALGLRPDHPA